MHMFVAECSGVRAQSFILCTHDHFCADSCGASSQYQCIGGVHSTLHQVGQMVLRVKRNSGWARGESEGE